MFFTCIKLGDILNDQNAFRDNPPTLSGRVENFPLQTETLNPVYWNFDDVTYNCNPEKKMSKW